jgi:hypothetical protein
LKLEDVLKVQSADMIWTSGEEGLRQLDKTCTVSTDMEVEGCRPQGAYQKDMEGVGG